MSEQDKNPNIEMDLLLERVATLESQRKRTRALLRRGSTLVAVVGVFAVLLFGGLALSDPDQGNILGCVEGELFCFNVKTPARARDVNHNFQQIVGWIEGKIGDVQTPGVQSSGEVTANGNVSATGNMSATGSMSAGAGATVTGTLNVTGDYNRAGLPFGQERFYHNSNATLVGNGEAIAISVASNRYRRIRIEIEGAMTTTSNTIIGVRPNNDTNIANYGAGIMHWASHLAGSAWDHGNSWTGQAVPGGENQLPICVSHWSMSGQVMCTGTINVVNGRIRMSDASGVFHAANRMARTSFANSWTNTTSSVSSLNVIARGNGTYTGTIAAYGIR